MKTKETGKLFQMYVVLTSIILTITCVVGLVITKLL